MFDHKPQAQRPTTTHTLRRALMRLLLTLLPLLAAAPASAATTPIQGGTLTYATDIEPPSLLSLFDTNTRIRNISAKITEGLLRYDAQFRPQPLLATSWSVSADGLRYSFKLRPGVQWHDGRDFTAADVRFSVLAQQKQGARGRITLANVDRVETPDPLTAVLVLSKPTPYLLKALSSAELPIVPAHRYADGDPLANPNNTAPVGTGPFIFEEWVRGSHVILRRKPNYWRSGTPLLDRVIYKFIPDRASMAAALETGEVDVAANLNLADLDRLGKNAKLKIDDSNDAYLNNAGFLEFNLDNPILAKPQVRHALAHAIDRDALRKIIWYGRSQAVNSPVPAVLTELHNDSSFRYPFDPALANRLLDQAGHPKKADGQRFSLRLSHIPGPDWKRTSEFLRAAFARIGIKAEVIDTDAPTFLKQVYTTREFDINVNGLGRLFDPTVGVQRIYWGPAARQPQPWTNAAHYDNPQVDELFRQAAIEADGDKRSAQFRQIQQIVGRDLPAYPLFTVPSALQVHSVRVHQLNNSIDLTAGDFSDTWIEPRR